MSPLELEPFPARSLANHSRCSDQAEQNLDQLQVHLSDGFYSLLAGITAIGLVVALVSNIIIIYLFTSTPSLRRNPSNILAVNLSLSDLLYCAQWPSVIYCSLTRKTWILEYNFVCQAFGFISLSTALASILTVLAMSIERAIVICCSILIKRRFSVRGAWLIIVLIWLVALASSFPPLLGKFNRYTLDPSETSCTLDYLSVKADYKLYSLALYVLFWIAPTIIISISYALIICTFKKSSLSLRQLEQTITTSDTNTSKQAGELPNPFRWARRRLQDSIRLRSLKVSPMTSERQQPATFDRPLASSSSIVKVETMTGARKRHSATNLGAMLEFIGGRKIAVGKAVSSLILFSIQPNDGRGDADEPKEQQYCEIATLDAGATKTPAKDQSRSHTCAGDFIDGSKATATKQRALVRRHTDEFIGPPGSESDRLPANLGAVIARAEVVGTLSRWNSTNKSTTNFLGSPGGRHGVCSLSAHQSANSQLARTVTQFRLAKTALYLILLWLFSWTPIASLAMINSILDCHTFSATAIFFANTMTKLGPTFDVLIYGASHPKIKSKFKNILRKLLLFGGGAAQDTQSNEFRLSRLNNAWSTGKKLKFDCSRKG